MFPPRRASSARSSATAAAGSSRTCSSGRVVSLIAAGELLAALHGGVDGVEEGGAHAVDLELADGADRGAAGRGDHLPQLDRVDALVAQELRRPEHRLDDEL